MGMPHLVVLTTQVFGRYGELPVGGIYKVKKEGWGKYFPDDPIILNKRIYLAH